MSSPQAYKSLLKKGFKVDESPYNRFDMLENNDDLEALIGVLSSFRDHRGNPAKFTMNNVVGNPVFDKIRESGYEHYFFEPFTTTYQKYPKHNGVIDLFKQGIEQGCFSMQFHGREHVNVDNWLHHLRAKDETAATAFQYQMFSVHKEGSLSSPRREFLDTYGLGYNKRPIDHSSDVSEGLKMFESIWKKPSITMIAPTYVWGDEVEEAAKKEGVKAMQAFYVQLVPDEQEKNAYRVRRLYQGRRTATGIINLMRNVFFEPVNSPAIDWVDKCLHEIDMAFRMRKPAIISTHRVNFMGGLEEKNRASNLKKLNELLFSILKKHSNVEFMTSDELVSVMN